MNILIFDNYDSFTYNLVHYVEQETGTKVDVYRNDKISVEEVAPYDKILLSPGPGLPSESGILMDLLKAYSHSKDIFGVCLGHQAIAESFGGHLFNMEEVMHGRASKIRLTDKKDTLFEYLPHEFMAGRYHSWAVANEEFPVELEITARDESGVIMGLKHKELKIRGVQFHPESVLTEFGHEMIRNWVRD